MGRLHSLHRKLLLSSAVILGGCAWHIAPAPSVVSKPSQGPLVFKPQDKAQWEVVTLPGKLRTAFRLEQRDQRPAVLAHAQSSASMLRQRVNIAPEQLGQLQFEWQVENLMATADMSVRELEDSPVRVILAFEGDRSQFSAKNAMLSELTQALTGEAMPYATLMYVWSNQHPVDTVIINPRTDRVRKWVVESGPQHLNQWRQYRRDIRADFEKAFGEPPGKLVALAIMTDSDNTQGNVRAWYGNIKLD
ncbi:MAG: hypothetical protein CFE39_04200 [Comamonadaceae bacterium PBBC2]|nr:MAG: hypothetical protein CFE39_04200 [Comamonadaceae bacterium PBBC2]